MDHDPAAGHDRESAPEPESELPSEAGLFPEGPEVSLDDADYADRVLDHAVREATSLASLSLEEGADEASIGRTIGRSPLAQSASRRRGSALRGYFSLVQQLGYLPSWPPGQIVKPGDVGILSGGSFSAVSNIGAMGVEFRTESIPDNSNVTVSTPNSIKLRLKEDDAPGAGITGKSYVSSLIEIQMRGEEAALAHWEILDRSIIENIELVRRSVLDLDSKGEWPQDCVLVTEVVRARNGLILVSNSKESAVTFRLKRASSERRPGMSDLFSALDNTPLSISSDSSVAVRWAAEGEFIPCFKASRVRRGFLRASGDLVEVNRWE
jgi:hypothetical protein